MLRQLEVVGQILVDCRGAGVDEEVGVGILGGKLEAGGAGMDVVGISYVIGAQGKAFVG